MPRKRTEVIDVQQPAFANTLGGMRDWIDSLIFEHGRDVKFGPDAGPNSIWWELEKKVKK